MKSLPTAPPEMLISDLTTSKASPTDPASMFKVASTAVKLSPSSPSDWTVSVCPTLALRKVDAVLIV